MFQRYLQGKAAAAAATAVLAAYSEPATKHAWQPQQAAASAADCADDDDCEEDRGDSWGESYSGSGWSEGVESLYSEEEVSSARPLPQLRQLLQQHPMLLR
jgi:hypothetical protein